MMIDSTPPKNIVLQYLEYDSQLNGSQLKTDRPTVFFPRRASSTAARGDGTRRRRPTSGVEREAVHDRVHARATHRTHLERETRLKTGETRTGNPRISRARDLPLENNRSIDRSARDWTRETNEGESGFREKTVRSLR